MRTFCLWYPSRPQLRLVSQHHVASKKGECPAVSANDILTSHLLKLSQFACGYMSINLRDRGFGVTSVNAGNYVHRVHLRKIDFSEPVKVREALSKYLKRGCDDVPDCWGSMTMRHGLVSNWAGLYHELRLHGSLQMVHLPVIAHPQPGFGFFIIFKPTKNEPLRRSVFRSTLSHCRLGTPEGARPACPAPQACRQSIRPRVLQS